MKLRKYRHVILAIVSALGLTMGLTGCQNKEGAGDASDAETVQEMETSGDFMEMAGSVNRFSGVIEARKSWSIQLESNRTVEEVFVEAGQEVKEGDPLFQYETAETLTTIEQGKIDLERIQNEIDSMKKAIKELEDAKAKTNDAQAITNYTIQIQDQNIQLKQKEIDKQSKELELERLQATVDQSVVVSQMDGVVKSVQDPSAETGYGFGEDNAFMTIIQSGNYQVKARVNEQNVWELSEGQSVLVHSRVSDGLTWKGTIEKIDREQTSGDGNIYSFGGDNSAHSSFYNFYVSLDSNRGLMLGQHVYVELEAGEGIMLDDLAEMQE